MSEEQVTPPKRRAAGRPAGPPVDAPADSGAPAKKASRAKAAPKSDAEPKAPKAAKAPAKKVAASQGDAPESKPAKKAAAVAVPLFQAATEAPVAPRARKRKEDADGGDTTESPSQMPAKKSGAKSGAKKAKGPKEENVDNGDSAGNIDRADRSDADGEAGDDRGGRRRRRRGRGKGKGGQGEIANANSGAPTERAESDDSEPADGEGTSRKRSRKRDRDGQASESGSTRLDAKRQRRREGREQGRRRAPILSEAEFLANRDNVERVMIVRQEGQRTQIAVLEDDVLVEHYISQSTSGSLVGNVYLGRVQNVLPGMEAAFVDIGKGRNAVLYAGEVNWDAAGMEGQPKKIEMALKSGDTVLVQVTKDPVGQKGARLTSQISLPGRFLVYVPNNPMTGISRKLPDRERARLKSILKQVVPENGGVIVRTAASGATEEEISSDVSRLAAQWVDIEAKAQSSVAPTMLYGEPDIAIKVVRDIFNEDVKKLIVAGDDAWDTVDNYVKWVAPDLADRLERYVDAKDVFAQYRIDEQLAKALDRKVYLPSGGSLVIDRTEAMTVVDVNTGKFVGQGGNLEQTVTKNNLEAAEEIVRQLRLRDVGGIIVIDFIDMVLESNRDQVIRRLIECLGRDRTKHQVAEVTSLGLVQMTRKRIGAGLLEVFGQQCDHCAGRGLTVHMEGGHPKVKKSKESSVAAPLGMLNEPQVDHVEGTDEAPEGHESPETSV